MFILFINLAVSAFNLNAFQSRVRDLLKDSDFNSFSKGFNIKDLVSGDSLLTTASKVLGDSANEKGSSFIVLLNDSCNDAHTQKTVELLNEFNFTIHSTYDQVFAGFHFTNHLSYDMRQMLQQLPWVKQVEPNYILKQQAVQDVSSNTNPPPLWGLDRLDQKQLPLDGRLNFVGTGKNVNVYILDSGIDVSHSEFDGRAKSVFVAPGLNGMDGSDCLGTDQGHGTHVAGIIGGRNVGVAKNVNLNSLKVVGCDDSSQNSDVVAALNWIVQNAVKPAIVSMSLGPKTDSSGNYPRSSALDNAIAAVVKAGITVVVAAGNDGVDACSGSPAGSPGSITVGASNEVDYRASFSNFGACLGMFAPGTNIYSAKPGGGFHKKQGTSQAAPFVSGAAAILLEKYPNMSPAEVLTSLRSVGSLGVLKSTQSSKNILLQLPAGVEANVPLAPAGSLDFGIPPQNFWLTKMGYITIGGICAAVLLIAAISCCCFCRRRPKTLPPPKTNMKIAPTSNYTVSPEQKYAYYEDPNFGSEYENYDYDPNPKHADFYRVQHDITRPITPPTPLVLSPHTAQRQDSWKQPLVREQPPRSLTPQPTHTPFDSTGSILKYQKHFSDEKLRYMR